MTQLVSIFFNVLAPVFSLVLIGYLAGPRLGIEARSGSKLAYYILTPPFIFAIFKDAEINAMLAVRMSVYILLVSVAIVLVAFVVARYLLRVSPQMTAAFVLLAAFGNVGNFGLPIIQFKLGEEAMLAASVRASATWGSSRCPSKSTKNRYSQGLLFTGRDWIDVKLTLFRANDSSRRWSAPL